MNREQIRRTAYERIAAMDAEYAGYHVPEDEHAYYRLLAVVYHANLQRYYDAFGWMPFDEEEAARGKASLGWGCLSIFERHVIKVVNDDIDKREADDARRRAAVPAQRVQPDVRA